MPAALLSYGLTLAGILALGVLAGVGMLILLRWVLRALKSAPARGEWRSWAGNDATFLFCWLVFWILLLWAQSAGVTGPAATGPTIESVVIMGAQVQCDAGASYVVPSTAILTVTVGPEVVVTQVTATFGTAAPISMNHTGDLEWKSLVWPPQPGPPTSALVVAYDAAGHTDSCAFAIRRV